ncbi:MAG: hypothetical protein ACPL88_02820 [Bryobacteraceae bacterium]
MHAAPAGDRLRLEIEPERERVWEWVVHHVKAPAEVRATDGAYAPVTVGEELGPGHWWYDEAKGNLHVCVRAAAGLDHVIFVSFPPGQESFG